MSLLEAFAARFALESSLLLVDPLVSDEVAATSEGFP